MKYALRARMTSKFDMASRGSLDVLGPEKITPARAFRKRPDFASVTYNIGAPLIPPKSNYSSKVKIIGRDAFSQRRFKMLALDER
jgi:hypothetical protein